MAAAGDRQASGGHDIDRLVGTSGTSPRCLARNGGHKTVHERRNDDDDRGHQEPGGKPKPGPTGERRGAEWPGMVDADGAGNRRGDSQPE